MTDPRAQRPEPDQGATLSPGPARTTTSSSSPAAGPAAAVGPGPAAAPGGNAKWWTLVAVCLGTFMLLLDITIVNVALPDIQAALGASFSGLQWVIDAYALSLASLLLTAGSLADMYGRRRLYLIGLVIFTGASLLCGAATSTLMLQLSRGLQGVGGAIMFSVALALLASTFHGKDRGVAFGVWGAITGLAVAIGPLLGGGLTSGLSWRWIFFVNLPIGIVAVIITALRVAETRAPQARRPDWAGFVLFTAALATLVYGLIESNRRSFSDPLVLGCLIASGVLLAAFVISASIFALLLYLVLYLQDILGYSALGTGVRLLILSGAILVASAIAGRLTAKIPVRLLIGPGLLLVGVGLLLMRGLDAGSSWTHLIPGLIVSGVGVGMINPPLASTAVGVVKPERAGMASGINSTFRQVGIATGIALLGTLFTNRITSDVLARTSHVPRLAGHGPQIASALQSGAAGDLLRHLPPAVRGPVEFIATSSFTDGLNLIILVAAIIAFVSGVISLATIRGKDFVAQAGPAVAD